MAGISCPDKILHFPNNMPIEISYKNTRTYTKCRSYDNKLMTQGYVWHQVRIVHNGKIYNDTMARDALNAIFEAIDGEEMFPIAYRHGEREDCFLVRNCAAALTKLFAQELRVQLSNGQFVNLVVQFNVADYKFGQIAATTKIAQALNELYNNMERVDGVNGILNLSEFEKHREFFEIVINLSNTAVMARICDAIYRNDEKFRTLNGINLSKNRLTTLAPLQIFQGVDFVLLDLRDNNLASPGRLCRELKDIKAEKLLLAGNPITKTAHYPDCLKPILKNFKFVDGIPSENLSKDYTPMNCEVDLECDGYRIDWTNNADISKFEKSDDWHAVLIPDPDEEFTKEKIFDYFFITISPDLSEFFPCYYKYFNYEHRFMVRNCFDQLKHLVENCNLEIKIPRLATPPTSPRNGNQSDAVSDLAARVMVEKSLVYYLRMNISPFKAGQIEPLVSIQKALDRRFSSLDRMLNLESFETIEGLESVVINLSSTKILNRILTLAARKFMCTCVELRLGKNKIMSMSVPKSLYLMNNLKAIDLGNNWIHDLKSIKDLQELGLRSLRLDGNPLCSQYTMAGDYIKAVRQYFPELTKLDNIEITARGNLCSQKNFLCDVRGYDFVEDFVPKFFRLFESDNRIALKDFYHSHAKFTMTFTFKVATITSHLYQRMAKYSESARNLYKMHDFSRSSATTFVGINDIIGVLMRLPQVSHDIVSFSTDTIIFNENLVVITVHGTFLDQVNLETDIPMAFTRTFVLMPVETNLGILQCGIAYKIINDQLNIYNPTALQNKTAFRFFQNEPDNKKCELTVDDREALLIMFKCVTNLTAIWCSRCLDDAKWDFKKALERFMILCEQKEIPDAAFV